MGEGLNIHNVGLYIKDIQRCASVTLGLGGVRMETAVITPNVPSPPIKSCFKS